MHGSGILAVWNDCAVGSEETYEKFHNGYVLAIKAFLNKRPENVLN